jgi:hypothetical protein
MAQAILRINLKWTGFQGSPGTSAFYFNQLAEGLEFWEPTALEANEAGQRVRTFADGLKSTVAPGVIMQVDSEAHVLSDEDGHLISVMALDGGAPVVSTALPDGYSGASGVVVNWKTNVVRRRRRIRGRTFIVPCNRNVYGTDGTLLPGTQNGVRDLALAMVNSNIGPDFGVWARPTPILDAAGKPTGEFKPDGVWAPVTAVTVPDLAAVLRSRR